ncbi:hypothetical protein NQ318_007868 [Aromia moschata]|uniref:Uncharacterized protein n=1 Tax=Aromia moschata TaxID=1265417 RepID=A0AAV8XMV3_9CUCU|nr:hypothetical protein NQ318_007868 [Aromia moschata]
MKNLKSVSVQVIDSDIAVLLPNGVYEIKQMETKSSRLKQICLFCLALCVFGIFGFGYFCPDKVCALSSKETSLLEDNLGKPLTHTSNKVGLSYDDMLNDDFSFDMDSHDVMVFLHMQKTVCYSGYPLIQSPSRTLSTSITFCDRCMYLENDYNIHVFNTFATTCATGGLLAYIPNRRRVPPVEHAKNKSPMLHLEAKNSEETQKTQNITKSRACAVGLASMHPHLYTSVLVVAYQALTEKARQLKIVFPGQDSNNAHRGIATGKTAL